MLFSVRDGDVRKLGVSYYGREVNDDEWYKREEPAAFASFRNSVQFSSVLF